MRLVSRFIRRPNRSFFLFGPRGTGKSTWVADSFPDALVLDMLDPETFRAYSGRAELLRDLVLGNPDTKEFVIDEVQKVPELLSVVHALIEEKKGLQFILTGSSARKIKRSGVDLLAGRALLRELHPFMPAELGKRFSLESALEHGLVPLVVASADAADVLRSYAALYVQEEVKTEGFVRNIGGFSRFLEAVCFSHGAVLNISNVARECEVKPKTVAGYISILEDLLLAFRLPAFTRRAVRKLAQHPKFYLFDAGVYRSLRPRGPLDRPEEIAGAALEGLVVQNLRAWNAYRGDRHRLYYWRTRWGMEVDVIVYGEDGLWAIEIKNTRRVNSGDLKALRAFKEDYPESHALFLYRGTDRLKKHEIMCLPCEDFLSKLHPDRHLPA
jgi:predicted AAA+ superfamily ATPase